MEQDEDQIIDVLIAIDAETIISQLGTNTDPNNPAQVTDATLIYMVTKQADAMSGNAGNELNIKAETEDVIRWRETSLSLNSDYVGILYGFQQTGGGDQLISPPTPLQATVTTPLPNPADPLHPTTQQIENYFWETTVLNPGTVTYHFKFMIIDRHSKVLGYYWWDPFITISA